MPSPLWRASQQQILFRPQGHEAQTDFKYNKMKASHVPAKQTIQRLTRVHDSTGRHSTLSSEQATLSPSRDVLWELQPLINLDHGSRYSEKLRNQKNNYEYIENAMEALGEDRKPWSSTE
jgi:hypothetical protein